MYASFAAYGAPTVAYQRNAHAKVFFTEAPLEQSGEREVQLDFSTGHASDKFMCSLDGAAFSACSSPKRYSRLSLGRHSFRVMVRGDRKSKRTIRWVIN